MTPLNIGDVVDYFGQTFTVLGFAATEDEDGHKLVEVAWNDYNVSPTGYLALPRKHLIKKVV